MGRDLVELVSTAPRRALEGVGYRQQSPVYDPLSGDGARIHSGRFNPPDSFPVLYLCTTPGCAAAEFMRFASNHPIGPSGFLPRTLWRYEIRLSDVLDLTEVGTLGHLDLDARALVEHNRTLTQQIGHAALQSGYQAVLNASATGVDHVVAVLIQNLHAGVVNPEIDQRWDSINDLPLF